MTIKSVIKKEETIEKEIRLPYFCKYIDRFSQAETYFKLLEDCVIDVMPGSYKSIASYQHGVNTAKIANSTEITEQEFNEVYHKALFEIGKYVPAPDVPKELIKDEFVELAEFLNQILGEEVYPDCEDFKMPESVIQITANLLRSDFNVKYKRQSNGKLYYAGMTEDYGGYLKTEYLKHLPQTANK